MDSQTNKIPDLPLELVENILMYADGNTLLCASRVCNAWRNVLLHNPSKKISLAWKKACFTEIPNDFRTDILRILYPKYFFDYELVNWMEVFKSWIRWKHPSSWELYYFKLLDFPEEISCVYKSGSWLIVLLPFDGKLIAYNVITGEEKLIFQGDWINSFKLVCDVDPELLDSDDEDSYLPGIRHDKAIITLNITADAVLDLHSGDVKLISALGTTEDIRYFENCKVQLVRKSPFGVELCAYDLFSPDKICKKTVEETSEVHLLDLWNDKVLLKYKGNIITDSTLFHKFPYYDCANEFGPIRTSKLITSRYSSIIVQVIDIGLIEQELNVYVPSVGHNILSPYKSLRINVSCVLIHAGMLFIGSEQGRIYGYLFESLEGFLYLDLKKFSWSFEDIEGTITSIDVEMGETPSLWVSTKHTVVRLFLDTPSPHGDYS